MSADIPEQFENAFPLHEEYLDHSGRPRRFEVSLRKGPTGDFFVEAREPSPVEGYRFEVYSTIYSMPAVGDALGRLRVKIRKVLATRYLHTDAQGRKVLTHNEISGRISCDGIVVDGTLVSFKELAEILTASEGFDISVKIGNSE